MVLGSEPERFIHQDYGYPAGGHCLVDDQDGIYSTGNAVGLPGPPILKRKAVVVEASQSCIEIGNNLLGTDDQDHVTRPGSDRAELAPARGGNEKRTLLRQGVDTSDDPIRRSGELTHLTTLHFPIHLVETGAKRLILSGSLDVLGYTDGFERAGSVVIDLGSHREERLHGHSRFFAGVDHSARDPVAFKGAGHGADLPF